MQDNQTRFKQFSKDIIYIPHWIVELCERHNLPLTDLTNYSKMYSILSLDEQAILIKLQDYNLFDCYFDSSGLPTNGNLCIQDEVSEYLVTGTLLHHWRKSISLEDKGSKVIINNALSLSYSTNTLKQELDARLFSPSSAKECFDKPFKVIDLDRDTFGVVIYPGYFNMEKHPTFKLDLIVSILKVLYMYNTYALVCKTKYFRKYLEIISK